MRNGLEVVAFVVSKKRRLWAVRGFRERYAGMVQW